MTSEKVTLTTRLAVLGASTRLLLLAPGLGASSAASLTLTLSSTHMEGSKDGGRAPSHATAAPRLSAPVAGVI